MLNYLKFACLLLVSSSSLAFDLAWEDLHQGATLSYGKSKVTTYTPLNSDKIKQHMTFNEFEIQEFSYASSPYQPFSIDFSLLKDSDDSVDQLKALFNYKGVKFLIEKGESLSTVNQVEINDKYAADNSDPLPTSCHQGSSRFGLTECLRKTYVPESGDIALKYDNLAVLWRLDDIRNVGLFYKNLEVPAYATRDPYPTANSSGTYNDVEGWEGILLPRNSVESYGVLFHVDTLNDRIYEFRSSGRQADHTWVAKANWFIGLMEIEPGEEYLEEMNSTYGTDYTVDGGTSEFFSDMELRVGYLGMAKLDSTTIASLSVGVRFATLLVAEPEGGQLQDEYRIEDYAYSGFKGVYANVALSL